MKKGKMKSALDKSFRKTGKEKSQIQHHKRPVLMKFAHTDEGALAYGVL